ncbi:MAG: cob(I)yrinic acid a,c-diamide adenosyltransferase [Methylococcaceae bacterium]|nr:cob(I)yrinic acid a,c-diamide adenosyltransferase [Methylococcaceae bacterium]
MGHRLSKIYTRTGDDGTTGLGDGSRVPKDSLRLEAIGALDELNSHLGLVVALGLVPELEAPFSEIQQLLFDLGGELSLPGHQVVDSTHVDWLERELDRLNDPLPRLKEFILPGGSAAAAACHIARTVCRRGERLLVALTRESEVRPEVLAFINRLSDFLFVACRILARSGGGEVLWRGPGRGAR